MEVHTGGREKAAGWWANECKQTQTRQDDVELLLIVGLKLLYIYLYF